MTNLLFKSYLSTSGLLDLPRIWEIGFVTDCNYFDRCGDKGAASISIRSSASPTSIPADSLFAETNLAGPFKLQCHQSKASASVGAKRKRLAANCLP
jgi:hypothetical protein